MRPQIPLIACGIMKEEIRLLIARNNWPVDPIFLPSSLHVDFDKLQQALEQSLLRFDRERCIVFYGVCHPLMDQILGERRAVRTPGQNCVAICLGTERFSRELAAGAFFLFEDWARNWERVVGTSMPGNPLVMQEIFSEGHSYLLAIRTPCSGDYRLEAEEVSRRTGLELRWLDIDLEQLEEALATTIDHALERADD